MCRQNLDIKIIKNKVLKEKEDILDENGRFAGSIHPAQVSNVVRRNPYVKVLRSQVTDNPK